MIEAGKYYLCTETVGNISFPQLGYYLDDEGTFRYGFHSKSDTPCIIKNRIYESPSDGFIIDSIGQRIKVCRKTEHCLKLLPFELSEESKRRIELYTSRGINVSIRPSVISLFSVPGLKSYISADNPTIGVYVELSTNFDKHHFFAIGIGYGKTQEEAFTFAWKNLRVSTPFIKRIKHSFAGYRQKLYREFINYERIR